MLGAHLRFWLNAIAAIAPRYVLRAEFSAFDAPVLLERFRDTVSPNLRLAENAALIEDPTRDYYNTGALRIAFEIHPSVGEIGDGGFTDWTAQLMSDSKERCLISCISTERLAAAADVSFGS